MVSTGALGVSGAAATAAAAAAEMGLSLRGSSWRLWRAGNRARRDASAMSSGKDEKDLCATSRATERPLRARIAAASVKILRKDMLFYTPSRKGRRGIGFMMNKLYRSNVIQVIRDVALFLNLNTQTVLRSPQQSYA